MGGEANVSRVTKLFVVAFTSGFRYDMRNL